MSRLREPVVGIELLFRLPKGIAPVVTAYLHWVFQIIRPVGAASLGLE